MTPPTAPKAQNGSLTRLLLVASISVNVTGLGAWLAFGRDGVTRAMLQHHEETMTERLEAAVAAAPFPWLSDREVVMDHVRHQPDRHESDDKKRDRIRAEIHLALEPLKVEIEHVQNQLSRVLEAVENGQDR